MRFYSATAISKAMGRNKGFVSTALYNGRFPPPDTTGPRGWSYRHLRQAGVTAIARYVFDLAADLEVAEWRLAPSRPQGGKSAIAQHTLDTAQKERTA